MRSHTHRILTSSVNPNWETPQALVKALEEECHFALDAAATAQNTIAQRWLGPGSLDGEDALMVEWQQVVRGAIFCNPPYCKQAPITPWIYKMALEGCLGPSPVIGVVPYSPQTHWWREFVLGQGRNYKKGPIHSLKATEVRLFPYRVAFTPPADYQGKATGANVNTAIVIWKPTKGFIEPWGPQFRYWSYK